MALSPFQVGPNPAPNPSGYASAAVSIYNALQSAAAQQGRLRYEQDQKAAEGKKKAAMEQWKSERDLEKQGYTPYDQTDASGAPTLMRGGLGDDLVAQNRVTGPDPWTGKRWVRPEAKPGVTPQQTYSDTAAALEKGGRPVSAEGTVQQHTDVPRYRQDLAGQLSQAGYGINAAVEDQGRVITPPGSQQGIYMPTAGETLAEKLRTEAAAKPGRVHVDTEHFSVPVLVNEDTNEISPLKMPAGVTHKAAAEKTDQQVFVPGLTGPNGGPIVYDKTAKTATEVSVPAGSKRELTPAQMEAKARSDAAREERQARADEAKKDKEAAKQQQVQAVYQKQHDAYQSEEQRLWDLKSKASSVLERLLGATDKEKNTKDNVVWKDGTRTFDVLDDKGHKVPVNASNIDGLVKYYRYAAGKAEERALDRQGKARTIRNRFGWGEFEGQQHDPIGLLGGAQ